jgi:RNA polymerase sigma-70 factor (ECF subfamily)
MATTPLLSDEELASQSQGGSLAAFEELVSRYEGRIFAFVSQFCRNPTDAREVTQETFVKAFQAIAQFNRRHPFASWLFTIARRKCIDHHRASPPVMEPVPELPDANDPAELLARQEDGRALWNLARRLLPGVQYQALWLRYAEGMDVQEIARVLRKTKVHVKVLLFRARRALASELEAQRRPEALKSVESAPLERRAPALREPGTPEPRRAGALRSGAAGLGSGTLAGCIFQNPRY